MCFTAWTLLGRDRANDELATSGRGQWRLRPGNCRRHERLDLGTCEDIGRFEPNESRLLARTEQDLLRIRQSGSVNEAQADTIRSSCDREDRVRRPFGRRITDDEEIVVV